MSQNIKPTPKAELEARREQAEALQNNPLWRQALDEIEAIYTEEWKRTEGPHADFRERAYYMVRSIEKLRTHINEHIITGKLNRQRAKDTLQGR